MLRKHKITLLFLALMAAAIFGYPIYEQAAVRRGSLALQQFNTLAIAVDAEARFEFSDMTRAALQHTGLSGSSSGQRMGTAHLSYTWDIALEDLPSTNLNMKAIAEAIRERLSSIVEVHGHTMRYYYPDSRMAVDASLVDSDFFHKKAVRVSLICNN
jgi:hypothetical protein